MEERRSTFRFGFLCWVLVVVVCGLVGYAVVREYWPSSSLLDGNGRAAAHVPVSESKENPPSELPDLNPQVKGDYRPGELDPLFAVLAGPGAEQAAGIRLMGYDGSYVDQLVSYVKRMSLMRKNPVLHQGEGTALLVIEQSPLGFAEIAEIAGHLGKIENKDERIKFIEVVVDKSRLESPPQPSVLLNPTNPRYQEANIQELSKLDNRRIAAAARRLSSLPPASEEVRDVVCSQLVHLLNDPWGNDADYVRSLALGLSTWGDARNEQAFRAVSNAVTSLAASKLDVPEPCFEFVAKGDARKAFTVLEPLWKAAPSQLEEVIITMGSAVEERVIAVLMAENAPVEWRCSAVRVLGEVGGRNAVPVLEALKSDKNDSLRLFAEGALRSLEKRVNGHQD